LIEAGIGYEQHIHEEQTWVFEFPIKCGPAKPVSEISLWEQAVNLALVQREWSDNAVSNTLDFKPAWNLIHDVHFGRHDAALNFCHDHPEPDYKTEKVQEGEDWNVKVYEYDPNHEEGIVEEVLSYLVPITKSIAMLPHTADGVYPQMPESGISEDTYREKREAMKPIDWTQLSGSDGVDTRYCDGDYCKIVPGETHA